MNTGVPDWLREKIKHWRDGLRLANWRLDVEVVRVIEGDENLNGWTRQNAPYMSAEIKFPDDIEDDDFWEYVIIHEMLHVAHANVDHTIEQVVIEALPEDLQDMARNAYGLVVEQYTTRMAKALQQMFLNQDLPPTKAKAESTTNHTKKE